MENHPTTRNDSMVIKRLVDLLIIKNNTRHSLAQIVSLIRSHMSFLTFIIPKKYHYQQSTSIPPMAQSKPSFGEVVIIGMLFYTMIRFTEMWIDVVKSENENRLLPALTTTCERCEARKSHQPPRQPPASPSSWITTDSDLETL